MSENLTNDTISLIEITAMVVAEHLSNNSVATSDVPRLIQTVHAAFAGLNKPVEVKAQKPVGAVSARRSLADPEFIVSMIDGKSYKMLRRHIGQNGHTPESYRTAYGLPKDYPMTSPNYAEQRRALAHKIGLGRKPAQTKAAAKRSRTSPVEAKARAKAHLEG